MNLYSPQEIVDMVNESLENHGAAITDLQEHVRSLKEQVRNLELDLWDVKSSVTSHEHRQCL